VTQNKLEHRITCVQKAVYHQSACLEMVIPEGNHGGASVMTNTEQEHEVKFIGCGIREEIQVFAEPLNHILRDCDFKPEQVAFVWCDAEGCEAKVIESGTSLWLSGVPIYLEMYPDMLRLHNRLRALPELIGTFFDGYLEIAELHTQTPVESFHPISELVGFMDQLGSGITDLLFIPKGFKAIPDRNGETHLREKP